MTAPGERLALPELEQLEAVFGPLVAAALAGATGGWRTLSDHELQKLDLTPNICRAVRAMQGLVSHAWPALPTVGLDCADAVGEVYGQRLGGLHHEVVLAVALDAKNRILAELPISMGGRHGAALFPADVLRPLIRVGASAFILVHNHPSGDPTPSKEDLHMTAALECVADVVGVPLLDHVVVGARGGGFCSILERAPLLKEQIDVAAQ